jgi:hypothetical protein
MDKNLKNALIIIGVLFTIYYLFSPYENCMRDATWATNRQFYCNSATKW